MEVRTLKISVKNLVSLVMSLLNDLTKSSTYRNQQDTLRKMYSIINEEIIGLDLNEYIRENTDLRDSWKSVEIKRASKNKDKVSKLLGSLPDAKISQHWTALDEIVIRYNTDEYYERLSKRKKLLDKTAQSLKSIVNFYTTNSNDSFNMLLNKYEDTFNNIISTIKEIKENSEVDHENQLLIKDILQSFIDEFNSLKELYDIKENLDKNTVNNSLKRRLKDELEFVNKIKTDWNSSHL